MSEEPQFHITVVTQKRRERPDSGRSGSRGRHGADAREHGHAGERSHAEMRESGSGRNAGSASVQGAEATSTPEGHIGAEMKSAEASADRREPVRAENASPAGSGGSGRSGDGRRGSHRRRYMDYGTVDLGRMDDEHEAERDFTADPNGPTPTQGELQRQFYRKYDAILNRRYFNRNRTKLIRAVVIALIAALIVVLALFALSSISGSDAETLEQPGISTVPVETIDLG